MVNARDFLQMAGDIQVQFVYDLQHHHWQCSLIGAEFKEDSSSKTRFTVTGNGNSLRRSFHDLLSQIKGKIIITDCYPYGTISVPKNLRLFNLSPVVGLT